MEDKKLTPTECMELIASMIRSTRRHLTKGEGNMLLFWGYLCVVVALLISICSYLKYGKGMQIPLSPEILWWIIPIVGIPYTLLVMRRNKHHRNVVTYSDKVSASLWNYVLWLALAAFVIGAIFFISGFHIWFIMELFVFFVVGMAVSVQGMIIHERYMVIGGAFSVVCGGFLVAGMISGITWLGMYSVPLFILSFIVMMIIPGHILNHKANIEQ